MFPNTPVPKCKHPAPALGTRKLVAMSGRLKVQVRREHETLNDIWHTRVMLLGRINVSIKLIVMYKVVLKLYYIVL